MATTYGKDYVDFDMDFTKHPSHGDLSKVKKSTAISRSIKNLLSTRSNERLFQPKTKETETHRTMFLKYTYLCFFINVIFTC